MHARFLLMDLFDCGSQWCRQGLTVGICEAAKVSREYLEIIFPCPQILQATTNILSDSRMWTVWLRCKEQTFYEGDEVLRSCRHNPCVVRMMVCPLPHVFWRHQLLFKLLITDLTVWLSLIE